MITDYYHEAIIQALGPPAALVANVVVSDCAMNLIGSMDLTAREEAKDLCSGLGYGYSIVRGYLEGNGRM